MKGRKSDNPFIVHISDFDMLKQVVKEPNEMEQNLLMRFFQDRLH